MFEVGMRVVCLIDTWHDMKTGEVGPRKGDEYVIRSMFHDDDLCLRFHWLVNPVRDYGRYGLMECGFVAVENGVPNFRPVIERETSIEVFRAILRQPSKEIEEV